LPPLETRRKPRADAFESNARHPLTAAAADHEIDLAATAFRADEALAPFQRSLRPVFRLDD
jgi:hypothetical protein